MVTRVPSGLGDDVQYGRALFWDTPLGLIWLQMRTLPTAHQTILDIIWDQPMMHVFV